MTILKSGDLVVLKSGSPVMTVDTVNTDIFDDNKVTGILCVWFIGEKLERARFDHGALVPAMDDPVLAKNALEAQDIVGGEGGGEYALVLDEMVAAMNEAADSDAPEEATKVPVKRAAAERPKRKSLTPSVNRFGRAVGRQIA